MTNGTSWKEREREEEGRQRQRTDLNRLQMIWKLRLSLRGEKERERGRVRFNLPPEFPSRSLRRDFRVPITSRRFQAGARLLARSAELCFPYRVTTGDESKMNRRRKSRRSRAISTENFAGEFTLAYLMAPLHHQANRRLAGDKVARRSRSALTLMMRNHVPGTRLTPKGPFAYVMDNV